MPDKDGGATPAKTEPAEQGFLGRFGGIFLDALPALVSAVGFLGFVAFIGAVIQWIRFSAAELPATTAVRLVPREDLIAEGAVSMVTWFGLGLLAVLMVFLLDRGGNASRYTRYGLSVIIAAELAITLANLELDLWAYALAALWLIVVGILLFGSIERLANRWRIAGRTERRDVEAAVAVVTARRMERDAAGARDAASTPESPEREEARKLLVDAEVALATAEGERHLAIDRWLMAVAYEEVPEAVRDAHTTGSEDPLTADKEWPDKRERLARPLLADPPSREGTGAIILRNLRQAWSWLRRDPVRSIALLLAVPLLVAAVATSWGEPDDEFWILPVWTWLGLAAATALLFTRHTVLIGIGLFVVGIVFVASYDPTSWLGIMLCIVVLLGAANLGVARATTRFAWYGATVFLSIALFGAALTAVDTIRTPAVQPAALVRKSDEKAMCGIYITQTNDRVYLGRVELAERGGDRAEDNTGRIFWVKTADIDLLTVGRLQPIGKADPKARDLRAELYDDRAQIEPPALKATSTKTIDTNTAKMQVETTKEAPAKTALYPTTRREPTSPRPLCTEVDLVD
jgi:hypothetical protein